MKLRDYQDRATQFLRNSYAIRGGPKAPWERGDVPPSKRLYI